ncbi:hypothetical protein [Devosia ginsengisoli]|nr:hypothetical protein [Devosia ginsengisoli]MCR6672360.1 hypothetical protein [Devosia ginsengisoli]
MDQFNAHSGVAPHAWLQHHLPWLGLLALMLGLFRESPDAALERDELNG